MQEINKTTEQNEKKQSIMENRFNKLKEEILKRAKAADACREEYARAYGSNNACELLTVVKDNFNFCFIREVIDTSLIQEYEELFNAEKIYANEDVSEGYLLASGDAIVEAWGNTTVEASGKATVEAWGKATVRAWGKATVEARGDATVEAWDNTTVRAWGDATVRAWDRATVRASGNAAVRAWDNAAVEAWDNTTVRAWDNTTVRACNNAYITSYSRIAVALNHNSIYRVEQTNTVYFASDTLKFEKVPTTLEAE